MSRQSFSYDDMIGNSGRNFFRHLDNSIAQIFRENGSEEQITFVAAYNRFSEYVAGRSLDARVGDNPDARQRLSDLLMALGAMQARYSGQIQDWWPGFYLGGGILEALRVQQDQEVILSWDVFQASLRAQRGTVDHAAQAEVEEVVAGLEQALQLVQGGNEHGLLPLTLARELKLFYERQPMLAKSMIYPIRPIVTRKVKLSHVKTRFFVVEQTFKLCVV